MLAAASLSDAPHHQPSVAARQSSGYSKLAAATPVKPSAPNWVWSEGRKLLPTVFQEIQTLCGREFTLDAVANDNGDNALCTNFCSPSNSCISREHTGHIWINAPFTQLTTFVQHYLHCKQLSPDSTSACILVPGYLMPVLKSLLSGMTCLKRFAKGAALFEQSTRSGSMAAAPSLNWPVYVFSDVPSAADQALGRGHSMHRLHNATVLSAASDSRFESDERLAMLFEGSLGGGGLDGRGLTAPILFDTGASSNFVSPRFLKQSAISYSSSSATLRLADDSSAPILGKVRLRLKLQSFVCTVTCYVTDLCDEFDVILGNSFMASHRAVLDYSNYTASLCRHGRQYTLIPRSISADKGGLPSQLPEPNFRDSCKTVPLRDSKARHNGFSDQNAKYTDQLGGLDPKLVLSCAQARKSIKQGCRSFLVLVTQAEIANVTLAAADVRESVSSSSVATAPATADPEQAHLLQHIDALQQQYSDVFVEPSGLPPDRGVEHVIPLLPDSQPPFQRMYRLAPSELQEVQRQVTDLLAKQLIEPSTSPFGAPILFVEKKTGDVRMVVDYRALNKITGFGLGAVLLQEGRPLGYFSRKMTAVESD